MEDNHFCKRKMTRHLKITKRLYFLKINFKVNKLMHVFTPTQLNFHKMDPFQSNNFNQREKLILEAICN
jgi:hypothetical protein